MNISFRKNIVPVTAFLLVSVPFVALADGIIPCNGLDCNFTSMATLVNNIINYFVTGSVAIAAITFSIAGGNLLLHPDQPAKIEEAKTMFQKTFFGLLIILVAWLVVHTLVSALVDPNSGALRFLQN